MPCQKDRSYQQIFLFTLQMLRINYYRLEFRNQRPASSFNMLLKLANFSESSSMPVTEWD